MNRLKIISAALAVILLGAGNAPEGNTASDQTGVANQQITKGSPLATVTTDGEPRTPPREAGTRPCQPGYDDRDSDLCAQWKAADAASASAHYNWWQLAIGIIGALGLVGALGLAYQANAIARDTAKRQLRAYLVLENIEMEADLRKGKLRGIDIWAVLQNVGSTPAEVYDAYSDCWIVNDGKPVPSPNLAPKDGVVINVTIGNTTTPQRFAHANFSRAELMQIHEKSRHLYVYMIIRYRDIFKETREIARLTEIVIEGTFHRDQTPDSLSFRPQTVPNFGWST